MDRTERFYKIERALKFRGCVRFDTLLEELGVSPATLKRDLQYLRDRLDAPIVYDPQERGYRLAPSAHSPRHELPGLWFSEAEIHALISTQQIWRGLDEGGVLSRHLQPMMDKLQSLLGSSAAEQQALAQRVHLVTAARRRVAPHFFERIGAALMQRKRIQLVYWKRRDRVRSHRVVSPQRLVHHRGAWYVDAWCHRSEGLRRFALDAVEEAQALDEPALDLPLDALSAQLDGGYGIYSTAQHAPLNWATLVFEADAAQWVSHEEWHPQQTQSWLPDGRLALRVPYSEPTELVMDILRHGPDVTVTGDAPLVQAVTERLHAALLRYPPQP